MEAVGEGISAGRRVGAFGGWGLRVPREEWGGLRGQRRGEWGNGTDGLGLMGNGGVEGERWSCGCS